MQGKLGGTVNGCIVNVQQGKQGICGVRQKANNITKEDTVQSYSDSSYTVLTDCYEFWPARRAIGHSTRMATDSPTGTDNSVAALPV